MKILYIIDSLGFGGAQTVVKGIFEAQKNNKNIYLFTLRRKKVEIKINHSNVIIHNSNSRYSLKPIKELKDLIKKESIDILHCHLFKSQVIGYILKKRYFPNIQLIFHEHGQIFGSETDSIIEKYIFKNFLKISKKSVNKIIAISKATKQKLIEKANIYPKKIIILYNFVDLNKFNRKNIKWNIQKEREKLSIKKGDFVVGFAGRLIERKGWKDFIESADILINENKKLKFLIAGDGPDREKMLDLIKKYNLEKNVVYLGYQSDMVKFYSLLDVFVIPSHWEPMGLTELEAQAVGIPLIAADVDGLNEIIIDNKNGLLFEAKNTKNLAKDIGLLSKNKNLRREIIKNSLKLNKKYNLDNYLKNLEIIYDKK